MNSPYEDLPERAFWSTGVANRAPLDPGDLYQPKQIIPRNSKFITAGSCFAQHIGRTLNDAGLTVLDAEPLPKGIPQQAASRFGYGLYSARYGNIYTVRHLLQLLREAFGNWTPENPVWEKDGRFYDAMRPSVEPMGLPTAEAVMAHRAQHLAAVKSLFSDANVFVFTLGLTESWVARESGTVYPTCPGTIAGTFDPEIYAFHNFKFTEIWDDFLKVRALIKKRNPKIRFILTVSPVPLTATASGAHVEVASCYSKSVLRAVAGALSDRLVDVDYFPSFEVITSQAARGAYYNPNLRTVSSAGVATAMSLFMKAHDLQYNPRRARALREKKEVRQAVVTGAKTEDEICEDALLQVFAK